MPRGGALLQRSREHHAALVLARDCGAASPVTIDALATRVRSHHALVLEEHFAREDALLRLHRAQLPPAFVARVAEDHAWLRAWPATGAAPDADALRACGARLAAHVRFEERELFPVLQPLLDAAGGSADGARFPAVP